MGTSTATRILTRAHTAVHLAGAIQGAIAEILTHLGLSARSLLDTWDRRYEPAIRTWIAEGSLANVVVEVHQPSGRVVPIFEFPITYHADGSGSLSHRHVAAARHWIKVNKVPTGSSYTIICTYNGPHTPQDGWNPTSRTSTSAMRSVTIGTLAAGPHASASARYYTH